MFNSDPLVASLPDASFVQNVLLVLLTGGLFVCLWLIVDLRRQFTAYLRAQSKPRPISAPAPAAATPAHPPARSADEPIPGWVMVAIASAVHLALGPRHRILSVVSVPTTHAHTWSLEGRRRIFDSHHVRPTR